MQTRTGNTATAASFRITGKRNETKESRKQTLQWHTKMPSQVPEAFEARYIDILFKNKDAASFHKYDLGLAKDFTHKIHLNMKDTV
jgi:hypothetical protein